MTIDASPSDASPLAKSASGKTPARLILTKPLVLVGLMGVGKTAIGKRLAELLQLEFIDADEAIEKAAGMSITDIFASLGESAFREGEHRVIARLVEGGPCVLATGGGAFINSDTRALIKDKAISLWMKTDLNLLARRIGHKSHRPLLKDRDPTEVLSEQAAQRYPHYAEADFCVETGDHSHAKTLEAIVEALQTHLRSKS
jgi:shikimate kinase